MILLAGLLLTGLAFGDAKSGGNGGNAKPAAKAVVKAAAHPASGAMQVEEPSAESAPVRNVKLSPAQHSPARGLTAEQKKAFKERQEKMQEMISLITEKRRALQAAKPQERAALARELHSLILEKDPEGMEHTGQARVVLPDHPTLSVPPETPAHEPHDQAEAQRWKQEEYFKYQRQKWLERQHGKPK